MKFFDIIPSGFFSVLVSKNKEIYVDALMILHEMFKYAVNIRLKSYISELVLMLEDREYFIEDDDSVTESSHTLSGKAYLIVNRFIKTGWIEKEFLDNTFTEIITPNNYSIKVLRMISEMTEETRIEYNSLVFSTYSALNQAATENQSQMYEALLSAKSNTETLDYELRTFYHGIRGYLKEIRDTNDVNFLLKKRFDEYKSIADKIYHPIKTMDSIDRFSGPIKNLLSDLRYNDELMEEMCKKALLTKNHTDMAEAEEEIQRTIDKVIDMYNVVTILMKEIDLKHNNYTKRSIDKIRYAMSADQSIQGKLVKILKTYSTADEENAEIFARIMEDNININRQEFIDSNSFYRKNIRNRRTNATPKPIEDKADLEELLMNDVITRIKNSYSDSRVKANIESLFTDNTSEVISENIVIENDTDYILTLLSVVCSANGRYGYSLSIEKDYIEKNGYRIPKFIIFKGDKKDVE